LYDVPSFGHYMQHFFLFLLESVNVIVQNTKNIINNFLFHELNDFIKRNARRLGLRLNLCLI